jgi:hypothetical protein
MRSGVFTDEENDLLRGMLDAGATVPQVAARLNRSIYSVQSRMLKLDLVTKHPRKPVTMPCLSKVRALTAMGLPAELIGKVVDRTTGSVHRMREKYGIKVPVLRHSMNVSVTDECHDVLARAGERHGLMHTTIARSVLETVTRDRLDLLPHVLPPPNPMKGAPISSLVHVDLQAATA